MSKSFNIEKIRRDFPILHEKIRGKPLVYLDSAATSQKPQVVIEALKHYYQTENSNIHRGVHYLSGVATRAYEGARAKVQHFLNAQSLREIIFVRGTTEAINLVAQSYGRTKVKKGDEIIISAMEHHSNIVPWQMLCEQTGALLKVIPINNEGELLMEAYEKMLSEKTRLVSIAHISNALGSINPVKKMIEIAHRHGVPVLVDGAQAVPHRPVDVQELDCDFYAFSGHKLFAPTGVGVLYGKEKFLNAMPPYQGGGDMISAVTFEKTTYNVLPYKFEAGTPNIAGVIGLGIAIDYVHSVGLDQIAPYENDLLHEATQRLLEIPGVRIIGTAREKASVISFIMEGAHPHDIGTILDQEGVAIRTGHHCAMPLMDRFHIPATARASLAFYNTQEEIDLLVKSLHHVKEVLGV